MVVAAVWDRVGSIDACAEPAPAGRDGRSVSVLPAVGLHGHFIPPVHKERQPLLRFTPLLLAAERADDAMAEVALEHEVTILLRVPAPPNHERNSTQNQA